MPYVIVPRRVASNSAEVWIAAFDDQPKALTLSAGPGGAQALVNWTEVPLEVGTGELRTSRAAFAGLQAGTRHLLELRDGGAVVAAASIETLPSALPGPAQRPFTVLLASCFARRTDGGAVGRTFMRLAANSELRPNIKILCGDQVYLDDPAWEFMRNKHTSAELERVFIKSYKETWNDGDANQGFRHLLGAGANYFTADDHEYWNNYPHFASYAPWDTWGSGGRERWGRVARNLYRHLQADSATEMFSVGRLSFFIADTRSDRTSDRSAFMDPAAFQRLLGWISGLANGPGVIVMGQPLFATRAGGFLHLGRLARKFGDWALPDHDQYVALAQALLASKRSIVVLTGDVHYGRIGVCPLDLPTRTSELIEIISSPLSLVDPIAGGKPKKPEKEDPEEFPPFEIPGLVPRKIEYLPRFVLSRRDSKRIADHFITVAFADVGQYVSLAVTSWEITDDGSAPGGVTVWKHEIR